MSIEETITDHIATQYLEGDNAGFDESTSLLELNIIDSSAIFEIVAFLRREFRVAIPIEDVIPENFADVRAIAALVLSKRAGVKS